MTLCLAVCRRRNCAPSILPSYWDNGRKNLPHEVGVLILLIVISTAPSPILPFCFLCDFTSPSIFFYLPSKEGGKILKGSRSPVGVLNPNEIACSQLWNQFFFLLLPLHFFSQLSRIQDLIYQRQLLDRSNSVFLENNVGRLNTAAQ